MDAAASIETLRYRDATLGKRPAGYRDGCAYRGDRAIWGMF